MGWEGWALPSLSSPLGSPSTSLSPSASTPLSASNSLPLELGMKFRTLTLVFKVTCLASFSSMPPLVAYIPVTPRTSSPGSTCPSMPLNTHTPWTHCLKGSCHPENCHSRLNFSEESSPPGGLPRLLGPLVPPLSRCLRSGSLLPEGLSPSLGCEFPEGRASALLTSLF